MRLALIATALLYVQGGSRTDPGHPRDMERRVMQAVARDAGAELERDLRRKATAARVDPARNGRL
jgi:hypothetical protein